MTVSRALLLLAVSAFPASLGAAPNVALHRSPRASGDRPHGAIVVACFSRSWFSPLMKQAKVPLWVGTTNLLAAEAYSVEAAIRAWADGAEPPAMRAAAGKAYAKYQKISEGSGLGAFSTDS